MAKIVLAMATTHGPQLHTTVEQWQLRVKADKGAQASVPQRRLQLRRAGRHAARRRARRQIVDGGADRLSRALPRRDGGAGRQVGGGRRRRRGDPRQRPGRDLQDRRAQSGVHGVLRRHHPELSAIGRGQGEAAARRRRGRARPRGGGIQGISRRARPRPAHHQDADRERFRRRRLEDLARACAQRRVARLRPHLPAGDARQGRAQRAGLPEHVLPAEPADARSAPTSSVRSSRRRSIPGSPTSASRCSPPAA